MSITNKTRGKVVAGGREEISGGSAVAGTNVTAIEYGGSPVYKTVLNLMATPITLTDEAGVVLYGGVKVLDLPEGCILVLGATTDLVATVSGNLDAAAEGDFGLGTVTASNNNTLSSTEVDILPSTAMTMSSSTGDMNGQSTAVAFLDGTSTAKDVYLNAIWDDADHNGGAMTVTGTITLIWLNLGDY